VIFIQGVYAIKNIINNKMYIGSAFNIDTRWKTHKLNLKRNTHINIKLQRAWIKYQESNFNFIILELVEDKKKLREREKYLIDKFDTINNGYNISKETTHPCVEYTMERRQKLSKAALGKKHSKETRQKISDSLKGKNKSIETIEKWKEKMCGRTLSNEHKQKLSQSLKGREITAEAREKLSKINTGKKLSDEHKQKISDSLMGKSKFNFTEEQINDIGQMIIDGNTLISIAKKYNCSNHPIKKIRDKLKKESEMENKKRHILQKNC
jgi:group I intron endonuclease